MLVHTHTITIPYIHESDLKKCNGRSYIKGAYQWCSEEGEERVDGEYAVDGVSNGPLVDLTGLVNTAFLPRRT
jgi:hypothetical protein